MQDTALQVADSLVVPRVEARMMMKNKTLGVVGLYRGEQAKMEQS